MLNTETNQIPPGLKLYDGKNEITNELTDKKSLTEILEGRHCLIFKYDVDKIRNEHMSIVSHLSSKSILIESDGELCKSVGFEFNISDQNKPTTNQIEFVKRIIKGELLDFSIFGSTQGSLLCVKINIKLNGRYYRDPQNRDQIFYSCDHEGTIKHDYDLNKTFSLLDEIKEDICIKKESFVSRYKTQLIILNIVVLMILIVVVIYYRKQNKELTQLLQLYISDNKDIKL